MKQPKFETFPTTYETADGTQIKAVLTQESIAIGYAINFINRVFQDASRIKIGD